MADRTVNRVFLSNTQNLATLYIRCANATKSLSEELTWRNLLAGGLTSEDFVDEFEGLSVADIAAFYVTLGGIMEALTPEQKAIIYKLKKGAPGIGEGSIPSI